jgi:hypothetical protein
MQHVPTAVGLVTPPITLALGVACYMTRAGLRRLRAEQQRTLH